MYFAFILLSLILRSCNFTEATAFRLSPLGATHVCPNDQLSLTCVTNASFLEWNITAQNYFGPRLVSSSGTPVIPSLTVNYTVFSFRRESREPLNVTLFITSATVDLRVFCMEYQLEPPATNTLQTTVNVIRMSHVKRNLHAPEMIIKQQSFGDTFVALTVHLEAISSPESNYGLIYVYGVLLTSDSVANQTKMVVSGTIMSVEVNISYNIQYNLSTFVLLCGYENQSQIVNLFYASCCPPPPPQNGYINPYSSTLEGAEGIVTCTSGLHEINFTTICDGGWWEPDITDLCTNSSEIESDNLDPLEPTSSHDNTASFTIVISSSVAASTALILLSCGLAVIICILRRLFQSKSTKHASSVDAVAPDTQVIPAPVYESIFPMEFQEQNLELKENVAYGPILCSLSVSATNTS